MLIPRGSAAPVIFGPLFFGSHKPLQWFVTFIFCRMCLFHWIYAISFASARFPPSFCFVFSIKHEVRRLFSSGEPVVC